MPASAATVARKASDKDLMQRATAAVGELSKRQVRGW
jgi:hypothetical protein